MDIILTLSIFFTLCCFTFFLYKDNWFWRLAENSYVGFGLGLSIILSVKSIMTVGINPLVQGGQLLLLVPIILGVVSFLRFSNRYGWVVRYPLAVIVGVGVSLGMRGALSSYIVSQVQTTVLPLVVISSPMATFNNIILFVGVITGMSVFVFSREFKGALGYSARVGRYILMVAFGAMWASQIMSRFALLAGRLQFLLHALGLA